MTVDVSWGGVSLAKSANVRSEDGGWFIEIEQPMPVGTKLQVSGEVGDVEVARVVEGVGAGMLVKKADSRQPTADSNGSEEATEKESKKEKRKKKR